MESANFNFPYLNTKLKALQVPFLVKAVPIEERGVWNVGFLGFSHAAKVAT